MASPLVDIDANSRHPDFKPAAISKIPNLPTTNGTSSTECQSSFSVSATGSPRYMAMSLPSRTANMSPTITSKIPRKGQMQMQAPISKNLTYGSGTRPQRSSLPRSRGGRNALATISPSHMDPNNLSPTLIRDKPLPSPPIAQIVNSNSPPKAQRTLVDAEAGSPSDEEWPILRPVNISSADMTATQKQRSVSEGSTPHQNARPVIKNRKTQPSAVSGLRDEEAMQMAEPHSMEPMNPYMDTFHAISTGTGVAVESPLTHKKNALFMIPPRISSKRNSLPLTNNDTAESLALPSSVTLRSAKSVGSTKWPVLEATTDEKFMANMTPSLPEQQVNTAFTCEPQAHIFQGRIDDAFEPIDTCDTAQAQYGSIDSNSTRGTTASSSLGHESHHEFTSSIRIKRLSWHSAASGKGQIVKRGPVLMIDGDADAVLLGSRDSVPEKVLPQRSPSALTGRVSRQTVSKVSLDTVSLTPTPNSSKGGTTASTLVKINPIRSMQPPRKSSVEAFDKNISSPVAPTSTESKRSSKLPVYSSIIKRCALSSTKEIQTPDLIHPRPKPAPNYKPTYVVSEDIDSKSNAYYNALVKADQDINPVLEKLSTSAQTNLPTRWFSPTVSSKAKKVDMDRSKTNPSLTSTGCLTTRKLTLAASASISGSPTNPYTAHSLAGGRHSDTSELKTIEISTPHRELSVMEDRMLLSEAKQSPQSILVSSSFTFDDSSTKGLSKNISETRDANAEKVKAKRSFRGIFPKREVKKAEKLPKLTETKRSSMVGSTLAKRFRNSTNFSKVNLTRIPESKGQIIDGSGSNEVLSKAFAKDAECQAALSSLESASPSPTAETRRAISYDTATVINKIITRVTSMHSDSPDRLRGLEIAEAILHTVECYKEAKMSAEKARKHARDAELNAERAHVELERLQQLCGRDFDGETLMAIKEVVKSAGIVGGEKTTDNEV